MDSSPSSKFSLPWYFTPSDVDSIIDQLTQRLPKSIASQLQECGALSQINLALDYEPTVQQEFCKLRSAIAGTRERMGILQVLPFIQRDCHHVLLPRNELRKANKVRRPDISRLPEAMSMPDNLDSYGELKEMFDVTVERSFETYENRLVKAYVQALQSQMSRLQARLESQPAPPAVTSGIEDLASEFRMACQRATFLRQVRLPFVSAGRVTMVLLKNPAYRAVLEDYLALYKQSPVRLEEPALNEPINKFPFLYQLWGTLVVMSALLQICAESGYQCISHAWVKRDNQGLLIQIMYGGEPAMEFSCPTTGRVVRLLPWRVGGSDEKLSTNQELPPGLAIAIYTPDKSPVVLLFDPKYNVVDQSAANIAKKTPAKKGTQANNEIVDAPGFIAPLKEDIDEIQMCMDQIKSAAGVREIQYAAILYPGQRKQLTPDIEALPARPADEQALRKNICDVLRRYLA